MRLDPSDPLLPVASLGIIVIIVTALLLRFG